MANLKQPEDKLFKALFSRVNNMRKLLKKRLPLAILKQLNLSTLRINDRGFIDEELREHFADLVYLCEKKDGTTVAICLLLEHKSYVPPYPPFQLLGYQIQVWKHYIANEEKPITVLPILFYHGKELWDNRPWKDFLDGMSPEFEKYTPAWEYILIDLSEMSDDEIWSFRVVFLVTGLLLFKHRYDRQYLLNHLEQLAKFVGQSGNENDRVIFIRYVFAISLLSRKEVGERIFKSSRIMKTASAMEEWKEDVWLEAMQEGKQKGRQEGRQEGIALGDYARCVIVVQRMLQANPAITNDKIAFLAGIEELLVQKIRKSLEENNGKFAKGGGL